jgi:hypothetical protein
MPILFCFFILQAVISRFVKIYFPKASLYKTTIHSFQELAAGYQGY